MYSEALAIMDKNTELYMIDRMKKEIKKKDAVIAESKSEIEHLRKLLARYEREEKSNMKKA